MYQIEKKLHELLSTADANKVIAYLREHVEWDNDDQPMIFFGYEQFCDYRKHVSCLFGRRTDLAFSYEPKRNDCSDGVVGMFPATCTTHSSYLKCQV